MPYLILQVCIDSSIPQAHSQFFNVAHCNIEKPGMGMETRLAKVMYNVSQFLDDFRTYNPQGIVALPKIVIYYL